jgi:hypothetical protein
MMENENATTSLGDWIDSSDACRMLNISKRSLLSYRHRGLLAFSKVGGKVYLKRSDIFELLEQNYHLQTKFTEKWDDKKGGDMTEN